MIRTLSAIIHTQSALIRTLSAIIHTQSALIRTLSAIIHTQSALSVCMSAAQLRLTRRSGASRRRISNVCLPMRSACAQRWPAPAQTWQGWGPGSAWHSRRGPREARSPSLEALDPLKAHLSRRLGRVADHCRLERSANWLQNEGTTNQQRHLGLPSPGADVAGASPIPARIRAWLG
jgi:hypothetical protein